MSEDHEPKKVFALVHVDTEGISKAAKLFVDKVGEAIGGTDPTGSG